MSDSEIIKGKKGVITSYRRGRHTQYNNQILIKFDYDNDKDASKLIGRMVIWETKTGKYLKGTITRTHGKKGIVRARFDKGVPGDAIGTTVRIKK
ncbi:MAG: 50S ribosomal protein L35ae [Candidatus Lokiarchaeota archaeon]|nr:50S ribosomal protein L35ae [Candidatus Lokiarchaeota archaeon]